jgi:hypothetical protein
LNVQRTPKFTFGSEIGIAAHFFVKLQVGAELIIMYGYPFEETLAGLQNRTTSGLSTLRTRQSTLPPAVAKNGENRNETESYGAAMQRGFSILALRCPSHPNGSVISADNRKAVESNVCRPACLTRCLSGATS